ncbi:hypothetical protein [Parasphingopyxis marina]|uniref:Uncharacterized protein n=1 Tax=Parasphingopyxis marina TaxID=2761622 RepID=A0A842I3B3_9SPHN|nr:hypothetical protein [Parasphingopyxis marina]MBC2778454.1 hypothetical protein [Parasphingopyxis marina]
MRDEFDARLWADHHSVFTRSVTDAIRRLKNNHMFRSTTMTQLPNIRLQFLAALAALSVSGLTILGTIGPIDTAAPVDGFNAETSADTLQAV